MLRWLSQNVVFSNLCLFCLLNYFIDIKYYIYIALYSKHINRAINYNPILYENKTQKSLRSIRLRVQYVLYPFCMVKNVIVSKDTS